jgi:hypothetical protein
MCFSVGLSAVTGADGSVAAAADDITPEMREFPHYKYMLMALFDTLYNLLGAFPTPHIGCVTTRGGLNSLVSAPS